MKASNCFNFGDVIVTHNYNTVGSIISLFVDAKPNVSAVGVYSKPNVTWKSTNIAVPGRVIGYEGGTRQQWGQDILNANPFMGEDSKYSDDYSKSAEFATELGSAFKHALGRTPKLAWEN